MTRLVVMAAVIALAVAPFDARAQDVPYGYSAALRLKIENAISAGSRSIQIHVARSGGSKPILSGTTNLPDGAVLQISLRKPWLPDGKARVSRGLARLIHRPEAAAAF